MESYPFVEMIKTLRESSEVILHENILDVSAYEDVLVNEYLQTCYEEEKLEHPIDFPLYDRKAALWGARMIYVAAQLMLYRKHDEFELASILPNWEEPRSTEAILSADLCLRFLPQLVKHLKAIELDDPLIPLLENTLTEWHFSATDYPLPLAKLDLDHIFTNECLLQLYADRVIENNRLDLADLPVLKPSIKANMGIHAMQLWSTYKEGKTNDQC